MGIRKIAKMGNPVLLRVAEEVADPTAPEIRQLSQDMRETLEDIGGGGIAAPQVYESKRMVVFHVSPDRIPAGSDLKPIPWTTMVNPVLTPNSEERMMIWERCLSIPGLHAKVERYKDVNCTFQTLEGKTESLDARDWVAMIFQHEMDHLDGILYPMRMEDLSLLEFNDEPGRVAEDAKVTPDMDPLFVAMAEAWPGRERWSGN